MEPMIYSVLYALSAILAVVFFALALRDASEPRVRSMLFGCASLLMIVAAVAVVELSIVRGWL